MKLRKLAVSIFGSLFFIFPLEVLGAGIVVNEVMFDPTGTDTALEWVELYNSGETSENLAGWQLYPDGIGYFSFPAGFILESKKFVVVYVRTSGQNSSSTLYHPAASSNMGNTSGSIALFSGEPRGKDTIKDFVEWGKGGETWETAASDAGIWEKGVFVDLALFLEGNVVLRKGESGAKNAWMISSNATPGAPNEISTDTLPATPASPSLPPPASPESGNATPPVPALLPSPSIKVSAGEDRVVSVGGVVEFLGSAWGLKGEPLQNARFLWNFGDGETHEGKSASHIFRYPGKYTIGLHISSGDLAASDYARVEVGSNQIRVREVIRGEAGSIRLENSASVAVDIGGWILEDSERKIFTIPPKTKISPQSEIVLANAVTGILKNTSASFLILRYPNSEVALRYEVGAPLVKVPEKEASLSLTENTKKVVTESSTSLELSKSQIAEKAVPKKEEGGPSQNESMAQESSGASGEASQLQEEKKDFSLHESQQELASASYLHANITTFFLMAFGVSILGALSFLAWKVW